MPRIRTIKPEFWGDEKLAPLAAIDRLVFLGLISMADDAGRLVDSIKSIDGFIFPETSETSRESLATLARLGRIIRYTSDSGQPIIQIANWLRHQRVDKASKYVLPPASRRRRATLAEASREPRENVGESSRSDLGPTTSDPDLRPPTDERGADGAAAAAEAADPDALSEQPAGSTILAHRLASDADRAALVTLIDLVPNPATWVAEIGASLDGMTGHAHVTAEQAGQAIRDWLGNGASERPNLRQFRRYLELVAAQGAEQASKPGSNGGSARAMPTRRAELGETTYAAALAAVEDL
jgi:hypothetical protein